MVFSTSTTREGKNTIWCKIHLGIFWISQLHRDIDLVKPLSPLNLGMTTALHRNNVKQLERVQKCIISQGILNRKAAKLLKILITDISKYWTITNHNPSFNENKIEGYVKKNKKWNERKVLVKMQISHIKPRENEP